ncbi:hypothetical protein SHKM778_41070 [Streptomyces sp. KM77-8]|uniref:thioredoxin-dependent peroxiredoxin n=1 Tax=Streptomyces haneummycinicus TaxID=3074435 RepID=A0AAT9HK24_9ACTN
MSGRVEKGDTVEDFALPDETGTVRRLSELLTEGTVVLFFYPAALTAGCTAQACHFRDLAAEFAAVGARPVGISGDAVERQAEFAGRHTLGMPLLSDPDGTVRERFGVKRGSPWRRRNGPPSSSAGTAPSWRSSAANCG